MKQKLLLSVFMISVLNYPTASFASDPLLLTPTEMQKLKQYFPNSNDNAKSSIKNQSTDTSSDTTAQHYTWNGNPITINLPVNQEKLLVFPEHVTADLKSALTSDQLQMINNDQSLYLKALKPFADTRLYVTLQDSQEVILIDIETNDTADNAPAYINVTQNNSAPSESINNNRVTTTASSSTTNNNPVATLSESETMVALTRYAWQQLYAPEPLLKNPDSVSHTPMQTDNMVAGLVYGDKIYAHPLASWELNDLYITAVELRNKYPHPSLIRLSHDICGHWIAGSLYPHFILKPAGNKTGDSTTLFLLSHEPFNQAMEVCHVVA